MTAITCIWTAKDPSRLDPGKPITTGLKNNEWDNAQFLMEWLGADYLAGAVQNHDHDGVNSAPIEALPNLVKNGSFERDGGGGIPAGWNFTAYTGGSGAIVTATQKHGRACVGITSTVLANGGGYYESANYFEVGGGEDYLWKIWRQGSVANISSKTEIIWYDAAEAQISVSTLFTTAATETSFTEARGRVSAPTTARLAKLRLTGGVPATGAAVGTVYFDGVMVPDVPRIDYVSIQPGGISQANLAASSVGQSQMKTATGQVSVSVGGGSSNYTSNLPGGQYGNRIQTRWSSTGSQLIFDGYAESSALTSFESPQLKFTNTSGSVYTAYGEERYQTGCRPYDLGDGHVPLFVYLLVDKATVDLEAVYAAPEASWHNSGPTNIAADFYDANGRGWRWQDIRETTWDWDNEVQDYVPRTSIVGREQIEITQSIKQADMPLIPHPFTRRDLTGKQILLLDPVHDRTLTLMEMQEMGANICELLHEDFLRFGNEPINRRGPPGVMVVDYKWKLT